MTLRGVVICRAGHVSGIQKQGTRTFSAWEAVNSRVKRSLSSAAAASSTAQRPFEKMTLNSSPYVEYCARSHSKFLQSSRTSTSCPTLTATMTASPSSRSSCTASLETGIRNRSCLFTPTRIPRSEISTWKISPARNNLLENLHHGDEIGKNRMSAVECRAAASDIGMGDTSLGLSKVPFLELLCSERAKVLLLTAFGMALCNAVRAVMSVAILPMASSYGWSTSFGGIVQASSRISRALTRIAGCLAPSLIWRFACYIVVGRRDRDNQQGARSPVSATSKPAYSFFSDFSSFLWGYLLSPIPGGLLADRYGGKVVMAWGVAGWSIATLATPWAARNSMAMLLTVRALMGVAEGVAMPCMNNMLSKWFPRWERSRAVGLTMAGFHLGSVAALLLSPGLLKNYGVSGPFWMFGTLGFLWLAIWCPFISKDPESNPHVSGSEFAYIFRGQDHLEAFPTKQSVSNSNQSGPRLPPIGIIFSKLPTWAIISANSMNNWGYFILLSWMPVYFSTVLGVTLRQAAWLSAAPWALMAGVGLVAGTCSDYLVNLGISITTVRKITQSVGFLGPAAALLQLNAVTDPTVASLWLTAALGLSAFSQAGFLVNHQEIAPRYAGFLHGVSNSAGTLAAIVSTVGTGFFIERLGSFQAVLTVTSILYIVSTFFWICTASGERIIS